MKTAIFTLTTALTLSFTLNADAGHCRTSGNYGRPVQHYRPVQQHRPIYQPVRHQPVRHYEPVQRFRPVAQPQRHCTVLPRQTKCFTHYCKLGKYNCKGMYSPQHKEWFYYYAPKQCYVPVKYIDQLPPVNVNDNRNDNLNDNLNDNRNENQNNNQNIVNINLTPALPTGLQAEAIPAAPEIGDPIQQADGSLILALPPAAE